MNATSIRASVTPRVVIAIPTIAALTIGTPTIGTPTIGTPTIGTPTIGPRRDGALVAVSRYV